MTPSSLQLEQWCRTLIPGGYDPWACADGFYFDIDSAMRAVAFFHECLTFTNAKWAGTPFVLGPWQAAIVGNLFGWKRPGGTRRYRKCFLFTARKSGKTELAAGIANYLLFCDGEPAPEIVSAAGNADQATKVFNAASVMVSNEPELARRARQFKRAIENTENGGTYKVINAAAKTKHGGNLHAALIDELHVIPDPELVDVLETSMRARLQPLVLYTTTAGDNPESIAGEVYDYAVGVRDRVIADDEFLPIIYECPKDADISKPENWKYAQPNLGVTVPVSEYERDYREALEVPRKMQVFRQLSLNQWTEGASAWVGIDDWKRCGSTINIETLRKKPAYLGIDLSSTTDTTALIAVVPDGNKVFTLPFIFIPRDTAEGRLRRAKRDKAPYPTWIRQGQIVATEGNRVDYDAVEKKVIELASILDIKEIQADPYNATDLLGRLQSAGLPITMMRQGWSLSEATKEAERLIVTGQLVHPNNPAFTWQISNVVLKTDERENCWPSKKKSTSRIDAAAALVMAVNGMKFGLGRQPVVADSYYVTNPELIVLD